MANQDLYEILGVAKGATDSEVKAAYRKQALKWHPDKHKGDKSAEEKFKEINKAYEVLSDKQKRQQYDTFGSAGGNGGFGGGFQGGGNGGFDFSDFMGGNSGAGFADIFETFFGNAQGGGGGRGRKKNGPMRGNDIEATISIGFMEAVFGCEKDLEISKAEVCKKCKGDGADPGSTIISCKGCGGTGEIRTVRNTILGQVATTRVCSECNGEGKVPEKVCTSCHGAMRVRAKERVKVKIPAGVDNGSTIRLSGKGEAGVRGGDHGDLYIVLRVESSKNFVRSGYDIHTELEIHLVQAVLGDEVDVETLYGPEKLKIPAGTYDGSVFKLSEKGVKKLNKDDHGNHLVKIRIEIPEKLSKRERELYEELAEEAGLEVKKGGLFW